MSDVNELLAGLPEGRTRALRARQRKQRAGQLADAAVAPRSEREQLSIDLPWLRGTIPARLSPRCTRCGCELVLSGPSLRTLESEVRRCGWRRRGKAATCPQHTEPDA